MKKWVNSSSAAFAFIAIICFVFVFQAISFEPHDFSNYYFGATFLTNGSFDNNIFFPHHFNLDIASLGYDHIYTSYAPHNPFLALFFVPFSWFSLATAKILFNLFGVGLFLFSLRNLTKMYPVKPIYLFLLPLVFLVPLRNNILFGQMYLLLFFLLVEGFIAYKKERYWRMGFFWGVAVLLKVIPIILFGFLLFKKKYKAIIAYGTMCLGLLFVSILVSGTEVWFYYFSHVLPKSGAGEITTAFVQNYQSMFMFLKGMFSTDESVFLSVLFLFKLLLLVVSFFVTRQEKSILKVFSIWIFISILLSPYGSTYTALLLIVPFLLWIKKSPKITLKNSLVLVGFLLISNLPIQHFSGYDLPFSFPRLIISIGLFIWLISDQFKYIKVKWALAFIAPVFLVHYFVKKPDLDGGAALIENAELLTYDYLVENGELHYVYWSINGAQQASTGIKVNELDTNSVRIENNQCVVDGYNLPQTLDAANKIKPALLNKDTLIYLSDFKRGIGFYELRYQVLSNKLDH